MRGTSLIEAVLAVFMLGLMFVVLMSIYLSCTRAWRQGEVRSELLEGLQVAGAHLQLDIERSAYDGLSLEAGAVSLLSPLDREGGVEVDVNAGVLRWSRYRIYYLDPETQSLLRREVALLPAAPQRVAAGPLEKYDPGSGALPLSAYRGGGDVLARNVVGFQVQRTGQRVLRVELTLERPRPGHPDAPERINRLFWGRIHN